MFPGYPDLIFDQVEVVEQPLSRRFHLAIGFQGSGEQVVNADRLGYSTYSIIEHFFFPNFGASPNPFAFFAKCSERTRRIKFRTLVHVLPYHNPTILASQIAAFDLLVDGRYEFGVGRGHGWLPLKAGVPIEESRERYEETLKILIDALEKERFSYEGSTTRLKTRTLYRGPSLVESSAFS